MSALYIDSLSRTLLPLTGRAWLCMALNEQALESYVRMFLENQDMCQGYYLQ